VFKSVAYFVDDAAFWIRCPAAPALHLVDVDACVDEQ
jgi:hypothetical protein